jgi:uncharacterized protein YggE
MRMLLILGAGLIGLAAIACTETTVLPPGQEATLGITVSGSASVFGEPDVALVSLGVEAQAGTVGEARTQAAERMEAMLQALKDGGVEDRDIRTSRFFVQPVYDFSQQRQEVIGFLVQNSATVKIRNIDDTGSLIDAAIGAGGDLARVDSLTFTIDDPTALQDEARREAMADARAKAETLAEAAGVDLGAPRSIAESGGPVVVDDFLGRFEVAAQDADGGTPIELGELEVRVDVQVVYGLD